MRPSRTLKSKNENQPEPARAMTGRVLVQDYGIKCQALGNRICTSPIQWAHPLRSQSTNIIYCPIGFSAGPMQLIWWKEEVRSLILLMMGDADQTTMFLVELRAEMT